MATNTEQVSQTFKNLVKDTLLDLITSGERWLTRVTVQDVIYEELNSLAIADRQKNRMKLDDDDDDPEAIRDDADSDVERVYGKDVAQEDD